MNEYIEHPLYGLRILHYNAPVKTDYSGMFLHESDSNYKVLEMTIKFLPMCHHYVTVPLKNRLVGFDKRKNVTFIPLHYTRNAVVNRSHFDSMGFRKGIDMKLTDFDFIFNHQPELMYNIMMALSEKRYGEIVNRFLFFHWVDNPQSRGSTQVPHGFMRQLEGINIADKAFFHIPEAPDYFERNFKKDKTVDLNLENVKKKMELMPLAAGTFPEPEPFQLPNKKILVFNHRWNKSTGMNEMIEYTKELRESGEYIIWCTDVTADKEFVAKNLTFSQYTYLLKNSVASMCFVNGYATWNLSSQDGINLGKPVLVYRHPTLERILGKDYPFFFKTKDEFLKQLKNLPEKFEWQLDDFENTFSENLHRAMKEVLAKKIQDSKYGREWIYYILNGIGQKREILDQTSQVMVENSSYQFARRWLIQQGVKDDPNSKYTNYFIHGDTAKYEELVKDVKANIRPFTPNKTITNKEEPAKFFNLE